MKQLLLYTGISALFVLMLSSCEQITFFNMEESFFEKETNFSKCHYEQKWDSISVENALVGTWEFTYRKCLHTEAGYVSEGLAYDSLKIYANHTLQLIDNDTIYKSAQWNINRHHTAGGPPILSLSTDPDILKGEILFCEDRVVFRYIYGFRPSRGCFYYHKRLD